MHNGAMYGIMPSCIWLKIGLLMYLHPFYVLLNFSCNYLPYLLKKRCFYATPISKPIAVEM